MSASPALGSRGRTRTRRRRNGSGVPAPAFFLEDEDMPYARPLADIEAVGALELAIRVKVSPLNYETPCHGYPNGCVCLRCRAREVAGQRQHEDDDVKQPWQRVA